MRSPKAGLADLKRLSEETARAREQAQASANPKKESRQAEATANLQTPPIARDNRLTTGRHDSCSGLALTLPKPSN